MGWPTSADGLSPLARILEERGRSTPADQPYLTSRTTLTYGELLSLVPRIAGFLASRFSPGERLLLVTSDEHVTIPLYFGALRAGMTACVVNPGSKAKELAMYAEISRATGAFVDAGNTEAAALVPFLPWGKCLAVKKSGSVGARLQKLFGGGGKETVVLDELPVSTSLPPVPLASSAAHILFTSGTTAKPKCVEMSHRGLFAHMATLERQLGYDAKTRILIPLPNHHTDGLTEGPVLGLCVGASVFRREHFSLSGIPRLLDSITKDKITHFVGVPTMLGIILQVAKDRPSAFTTPTFRLIVSLAEELPEALWRNVEEHFSVRVANLYGLTETVSASLYAGPDQATRRVGTLGKPVDCECRVVGEDGKDVPRGEAGELWIKGPHLLTRYFGDEEATQAVMTDGWLRTGDLVSVDADGFYVLAGRKKNLIIRGGVNISPEEISRTLMGLRGVQTAATVGVKDAVAGERVVACVAPVEGSTLTEDDIRQFCVQELAAEKVPTDIFLMKALPVSASGKVDQKRLREEVARLTAAEGEGGDVSLQLARLASRAFSASLEDAQRLPRLDQLPGFTSLAMMDFLRRVQTTFGITLTIPEMIEIDTLKTAERTVRLKRSRGL